MTYNSCLDGIELLQIFSDPTGDALRKLLRTEIPEGIPEPQWGKISFFKSLPPSGVYLDVGCGNNSPGYTKHYLPNWKYIGLDVGDYNQTQSSLADEYIITTSEGFCGEIAKHSGQIDAVMSSHNLEHCEDRQNTLRAMARALRPNGRIYISFPCHDSVTFPKRGGCLNYYDDYTHQGTPPDFGETISVLTQESVKIKYATTHFQPTIGWILGLQNEVKSSQMKDVMPGTWWYWGFETVIWGEKI